MGWILWTMLITGAIASILFLISGFIITRFTKLEGDARGGLFICVFVAFFIGPLSIFLGIALLFFVLHCRDEELQERDSLQRESLELQNTSTEEPKKESDSFLSKIKFYGNK